jgi:hypothetical protein
MSVNLKDNDNGSENRNDRRAPGFGGRFNSQRGEQNDGIFGRFGRRSTEKKEEMQVEPSSASIALAKSAVGSIGSLVSAADVEEIAYKVAQHSANKVLGTEEVVKTAELVDFIGNRYLGLDAKYVVNTRTSEREAILDAIRVEYPGMTSLNVASKKETVLDAISKIINFLVAAYNTELSTLQKSNSYING